MNALTEMKVAAFTVRSGVSRKFMDPYGLVRNNRVDQGRENNKEVTRSDSLAEERGR